jgi:hypothetical protein
MVAVSPRVLALPGGLRVAVSHHALERYAERVRPHLAGDRDALFADLGRLALSCGSVSPDRPEWVHDDWTVDTGASRTLWWLHCGDIALPLGESVGQERLLATTLLTRGGISDAARRGRNRKRSTRTWGARKTNWSKPPGRPRNPISPDG